MQIEFSPQRADTHANYEFAGDVITAIFDGVQEIYDFTDMPDGEITEIDQGVLSKPLVMSARRVAGELTVTLVLTHDHVDNAPIETRFPANPYTTEAAETLLIARNAALVNEEQV